MLADRSLNYTFFKRAALASFITGAAIIVLSFYVGKNNFFLLLNNDLGAAGDFFFNYFTYVGDGLLWIIWLIAIIKKRKNLLPLLIASFLLTTLFTQISKQVILPDESRPLLAIADQSLVHYVKGVTVHSINSFPSGHTATAFTFMLLIALMVRRPALIVAGFIAALVVGYSRIYLGQHFPLDIGAGIIVAVCSVSLSVFIQQWFDRKRNNKLAGSTVAD